MDRNFVFVHDDDQCLMPAFYLRRMPAPGHKILLGDVEASNGKSLDPDGTVRCGYCGEPLCFDVNTLGRSEYRRIQ